MRFFRDREKELREILNRIDHLEIELTKRDLVITDLSKRLQNNTPFEDRLITLELWQKKLSDLMLTKTAAGKETLTPFAKRIGQPYKRQH